MAAFVNDRDTLLDAAAYRGVNAPGATILLAASTPDFQVSSGGVGSPTSITFTALLVELEDGSVTFGCTGGTLTSIAAKTAVLLFSNMSADVATISATKTVNGVLFTSNICTVYKVSDLVPSITAAAAAAAAAQSTANTAITNAATAQTAANTANTALANIASDSILSPSEKPSVVLDYANIINEQAGIDAQATSYAVTTEKTTYDTAVSALTTYLGTLTGWNTIPGSDVVIVGTTFRTKFSDVYTARQALLNKIAANAKVLADAAQTQANTATTNAATAQTTANTAITNAATAQTAANTANTALANIASDSILSPGEKPTVVLDYANIINEQAGIDAQATAYSITTEKTTYDTAVSALTTYLGTLAGWNTIPGSDVVIVGATFRTKFSDVYTARQALLNKISANAKVLADAAQSTANTGVTNAATAQTTANTAVTNAATAQTAANTANTALANIASDSILSPSEKPTVVLDYANIINEQSGIDAQATAYAITTEKTTYDTAVSALTTYLGTLSGWNTIPGSDVVIVGATFRTKFSDVYTARQALLNKISANAKVLADAAQSTANTGVTNAATAQTTANTAVTNAATAQTAANTANTALANIASDSILSPSEKPTAVLDYANIINEQSGIDAQATAYSITTEKTTYDTAVSALTTYLGTLSGWNTIPGSDVVIVGATFRTKFSDVYTARQALLNKISANAKALADAAQTQANTATTNAATAQTTANTAVTNAATAQTAANTANTALANIASDSILSPSEKPTTVLDYANIINEQTGIDAQATAYSITTEKTTYDTAVSALTTYLGTLSGWNTIPGSDVVIVGATFRTKFSDVYTARQALLNKISANAKVLADAAQTAANTANSAINDATTGLAQRMRLNADNILGGILSANTIASPAGFRAGNVLWNAAGAWVSGTGIAITPTGLVGYTTGGVASFTINATTGAATFAGALSAATGSFGSVTVASGGSISSGQSAYNTGTGFFMSLASGVTKMSLGISGGVGFTFDGTNFVITPPPFTMTALSDLSSSGANGLRTYGTRTASLTGGTAPFTYSWTKTIDVGAVTVADATTATATFSGTGTNVENSGTITCTVTDVNGRVVQDTFFIDGVHGTPP